METVLTFVTFVKTSLDPHSSSENMSQHRQASVARTGKAIWRNMDSFRVPYWKFKGNKIFSGNSNENF